MASHAYGIIPYRFFFLYFILFIAAFNNHIEKYYSYSFLKAAGIVLVSSVLDQPAEYEKVSNKWMCNNYITSFGFMRKESGNRKK